MAMGELLDRVEGHLEHAGIETDAHGGSFRGREPVT
jgi:hypothetical protein